MEGECGERDVGGTRLCLYSVGSLEYFIASRSLASSHWDSQQRSPCVAPAASRPHPPKQRCLVAPAAYQGRSRAQTLIANTPSLTVPTLYPRRRHTQASCVGAPHKKKCRGTLVPPNRAKPGLTPGTQDVLCPVPCEKEEICTGGCSVQSSWQPPLVTACWKPHPALKFWFHRPRSTLDQASPDQLRGAGSHPTPPSSRNRCCRCFQHAN